MLAVYKTTKPMGIYMLQTRDLGLLFSATFCGMTEKQDKEMECKYLSTEQF